MKHLTYLLFVTLFAGCACKPITEIQTVEVKIPVRCQALTCIKPVKGNFRDHNLTLTERATIKQTNIINDESYTLCLEAAIKACTK